MGKCTPRLTAMRQKQPQIQRQHQGPELSPRGSLKPQLPNKFKALTTVNLKYKFDFFTLMEA